MFEENIKRRIQVRNGSTEMLLLIFNKGNKRQIENYKKKICDELELQNKWMNFEK